VKIANCPFAHYWEYVKTEVKPEAAGKPKFLAAG
jgi:hypothetical protein